jgi:hypothetical protein
MPTAIHRASIERSIRIKGEEREVAFMTELGDFGLGVELGPTTAKKLGLLCSFTFYACHTHVSIS